MYKYNDIKLVIKESIKTCQVAVTHNAYIAQSTIQFKIFIGYQDSGLTKK